MPWEDDIKCKLLNNRHNLREHFGYHGKGDLIFPTEDWFLRSADWREKLFVPPWTRRCREGAFHGIFARCSCTLRMQLAVKMLAPFFLKSGFFEKHGMLMNMKQQQICLRDPDPQNKKKSPRCILGDGVAWLVRCAFWFPGDCVWPTVDGSEILLTQLRLVVYKALCIPGGAGFLPYLYEYENWRCSWFTQMWVFSWGHRKYVSREGFL